VFLSVANDSMGNDVVGWNLITLVEHANAKAVSRDNRAGVGLCASRKQTDEA
jgi:hypothetical protein